MQLICSSALWYMSLMNEIEIDMIPATMELIKKPTLQLVGAHPYSCEHPGLEERPPNMGQATEYNLQVGMKRKVESKQMN